MIGILISFKMVKGPKTLNPADKARKEARKKELKKNKKQRQQVRSAVIESRNPEQILAELEQLDKQELDIEYHKQQELLAKQNSSVQGNATSAELVYKEKRKRLKELYAKILAHYEKEDPDKHAKLKSLEAQYEASHKRAEREFEAVKAAQEVKIEDVFLPPEPDSLPDEEDEIADDDPLMAETIYITPLTEGAAPPGCPPGPPPDLKLLASSLKSSIILPPTLATPHLLPPHLLKLANRNERGGIQNYNNKRPYEHEHSRKDLSAEKNQQRKRHPPPVRMSSQHECHPKGASDGGKIKKNKPAAKVIESKPVIFMPKATKFVPASVRSRVQQLTTTASKKPDGGAPGTSTQ